MGVPLTVPLVTQVVVSGLLLGGLYALIALGLTMVFGVMRVINVAHGTLLMVGAYITFWLFEVYKVDPLLSLAISMPLLFLGGVVLHWLVIRRIVGAPELITLLVTFGTSIIIINLALYFWTADFRSVPYLTGSVGVGGIAFPRPRVVAALVALLITAAAFLFLKRTRLGKAIRATSQHREVARACGIDVERIDMLSFGLGAAMAGAGGSLLSIMFAIYPEMGDLYTLKAFCIVILGGMGHYGGAFLGGLILGLAESLSSLFLSAAIAEGIAYLILVLVLLIKPSGLMGAQE